MPSAETVAEMPNGQSVCCHHRQDHSIFHSGALDVSEMSLEQGKIDLNPCRKHNIPIRSIKKSNNFGSS